MSVRGLTLRVATALCALAGALLLSSTSALAIRLVGTPLPAPTGGFSAPQGLGVGPSPNNEIFVENNGVSTVDVYGSNAIFKAEFPVAAGYGYQMGVDDSTAVGDPSKGNIYIAFLGGSVVEYTPTGTEVRKIEGEGLVEPTAVAVDPRNGDVYVADFVHGEEGKGYVNEYGPTGTSSIAKELITGLTKPEAMAVDSSGHILVGSETPGHGVLEYDETGACMNACAAFGGVTAKTNGLAVGPEGNVYVGVEGHGTISVFDSTGKTLVETITTGIYYPYGIGVVGTTVYVTNGANAVDVFLFEALLPPSEVETGAAEEEFVTATSAELGGKLNPGGEAEYYVEYGTAPCSANSCGTKSHVAIMGGKIQASVGPIAVSGLELMTTYHYWLVANNSAVSKPVHGEAMEFTTKPAPPSVQTGVAEDVTETSAKLTGELIPGGVQAEYYVEYLLPTNTTEKSASAFMTGKTQASVGPIVVSGLEPNTTYSYWLVANSSAVSKPVQGEAHQFTTQRSQAEIEAQAAAKRRPAEELAAALTAKQKLEEEAERAEETVAAARAAKRKQYDEIATETAELEGREAEVTVNITKTKVTAGGVRVTIRLSRAGTVTITGAGLKRTVAKVGAGTHTVQVALTAAGRTARKHHKKTTVAVSLKTSVTTVSASASVKL
jgi:hypothetical protein